MDAHYFRDKDLVQSSDIFTLWIVIISEHCLVLDYSVLNFAE
jgi:hypothetical protein